MEKVTCLGCSIEIDKHPRYTDAKGQTRIIHTRNSKYCSAECYKRNRKDKIERKLRKCNSCGIDTYKVKFCEECLSNIQKRRSQEDYSIEKRKAEIIKSILVHLSGGCCEQCGYKNNKNVLVFHHIDHAEKSFNLAQGDLMKIRDIEKILNEHKKCIMLCHNCHNTLHNIERNKAASQKQNTRRDKYIRRKLHYIAKLGGKCRHCDKVFDKENLQSCSFHHERDKLFELNSDAFISKSETDISREVDKCIILCINCHMELHYPMK